MWRLLVATDLSAHADAALDRAVALALRDDATLTLIHVLPLYVPGLPLGVTEAGAMFDWSWMASSRATLEESLQSRSERARAAGVPAADYVIGQGDVDDVIVEAATSQGADLVVVGTHGRTGIKRLLLGSVAEQVVRRSPVSVLVVREGPDEGPAFRKVLVGTDFSPAADKAARQAIELSASDAEIELVHVWQFPVGSWAFESTAESTAAMESIRAAVIAGARQRGEALLATLHSTGRRLHFTPVEGHIVNVLTSRAETERFDLIALGTHGYRGFRRFLLGSVASGTVRHAPCSVLVAHAEDTGPPRPA